MAKSKAIRERIAKLQKELKTQVEKEEQEKRDRKNETKMKILVGSYLKSQKERWDELIAEPEFKQFLVRDSDRKIFWPEKKQVPAWETPEEGGTQEVAASCLETEESPDVAQEVEEAQEAAGANRKRVYLISEYKDRNTIMNALTALLGKERGPESWNYDKDKGQWFFVDNGKIDTTSLKKWLSES